MSFDRMGVSAPEDPICRYEPEGPVFRGPPREFGANCAICIGGAETFGRFVQEPYPALLEKRLGQPCVNLGSASCGFEALAASRFVRSRVNAAEFCVVQLPGVQNLPNHLYRVHPRRNDRFLEPMEALRTLYPEVDFTEIHFTRHLLCTLQGMDDARFELVKQELREGWVARMQAFLIGIETPVILLWLRYHEPLAEEHGGPPGPEPYLVTRDMVDRLATLCASVICVPVRACGESEDLADVLFGTLQQPMAEHLIGPATHQAIADRLFRAVRDLQ